MEKELFVLLRLGLGISKVECENQMDFIMLTSQKWTHIIDLARKQEVLGIVVDGIEQLDTTPYGATKSLPLDLKFEIIGEVLQIELRNRHQMTVMDDLAKKWTQNGCRVMVMKGQVNATFYPKPEHRNPGDIDCYLTWLMSQGSGFKIQQADAYKKGNDVAREVGAKVEESWYKHSVISYHGEVFENHRFFVNTRNGDRGKLLEKELEESLKVNKIQFQPLTSFVVKPPVQWTAMFLTYHACAHFVSEGLRMKQLVDWAMFLNLHQCDVDWPQFYAYCERNHLRRFADAATAISVEHLGIKITNTDITTSSAYAEKILHSSLYDDDYVFGSGEGSWHNRLHLVRNLFHYHWKYEDIYETSPWRQLWNYASGFLFKTE